MIFIPPGHSIILSVFEQFQEVPTAQIKGY